MTDNERKQHYNAKGMYVGYDKNHKEREALDYYSTPTEEVTNILNVLQLDLSEATVLEPSAGGGHMLQGILDYQIPKKIYATDIQKRELVDNSLHIEAGKEFDFLNDDYPYQNDIDYIIMNPPYATIDAFTMRGLGIAQKGVLVLGRLQFLEGQKRFKSIFNCAPPNEVYIYVERITCHKNGIVQKENSVQAYAWFYWDLRNGLSENTNTNLHWIHKVGAKV